MFFEKPTVIFLNGASSSGKTTIAHALQELLPINFLHVGIDKVIGMMPKKSNDWLGESVRDGFYWKLSVDAEGQQCAEIQEGMYAHSINRLLKQLVVTMLKEGHHLIIDEVCQNDEIFSEWKALLSPYEVYYVGLIASDTVLMKRERDRKNRMIGSAYAQSKKIHQNKKYDLLIDTTIHSPFQIAQEIIDRFMVDIAK